MDALALSAPPVDPRRAAVRALFVAQETATHVPAYARFLRLAGYDAARLRGTADFRALPVTDKGSYLTRYPVDQRCRQADLARMHIVTLSSGSSGAPTLWPRFPEQDRAMLQAYIAMLHEHFRIRERWTLLMVNLAMGAWVAGTLVAELGQRMFAECGIRGTVATPGLNLDDTLHFVQQLSRHYDQTIFVGYPAPIANLLEKGAQRGIAWPDLNVGVFTGGEYISEAQRERILARIGKDPDRLEGLFSIIGSSEAGGSLGYETPLCLLVRRLCARDPALTRALFDNPLVPSLTQYNPFSHFVEIQDGEILLTMRGGVPLVRFNTHDRGGVLGLEDLLARCRALGHDLPAELQARGFPPEALRGLPFLYTYGRADAVVVHGANVYSEQLREVLEQPALRAATTGEFQFGASTEPDGSAALRIEVELRAGLAPTEELRTLHETLTQRALLRLNSELRNAFEAARGSIRLEVVLRPHGSMAEGIKPYYILSSGAQPPASGAAGTNGRSP